MSSQGPRPPYQRPLRPVLLRPQRLTPKNPMEALETPDASTPTSPENPARLDAMADAEISSKPLAPTSKKKSLARKILAAPLTLKVKKESYVTADDVKEQEEEEEAIDKIRKGAPPWMISIIFHVVALLVLALAFYATKVNRVIVYEASMSMDEIEDPEEWAEDLGEQTDFETESEEEDEFPEPMEVFEEKDVPDPMAAPIAIPNSEVGSVAAGEVHEGPTGNRLLSGRTPGGRNSLGKRYGATKTTEEAVENGLRWLARQQLKDGSWSLLGPYADGVSFENQASATAMALLAFQGAGYTTESTNGNKYRTTLQKGWTWLLKQQDANGNFYSEGAYNHAFYTQGQCAIAICELYGMTQNKKYLEPAKKAIDYIVKSQAKEGGWRYEPNNDSDVSVTGWCLMALQSARMAGLDVPQETLDNVTRYLDSVGQANDTRYPYQRNGDATRTMTAEAILCRQYLGWSQNDERMVNALNYVGTQPVSYENGRNVYYWYYATQAMHHKEGEWWEKWNEVMREEIPRHQERVGRDAGSWHPYKPTDDQYASQAGRLFVTCLSLYNLEVYYRHLPIYANHFDKDGLPVPVAAPAPEAAPAAQPAPETPQEPIP
ncbi:MAG: terpene cyclase/mutase family protein [Planctomycetia bacterium]|nr:terpene cyclase/mutase family protein [Planctomycetia bacterium]